MQIGRCESKIHGLLSQFDTTKNYYAVLGAAPDASRREIETLYRRLAHKRHPDRGGTEEEMKTLNEAYRVLHDEIARRQYDAQRRKRSANDARPMAAPAARDVGLSGQSLSAVLCLLLGLVLLMLVRFNGMWFLWPMAILALGVMLFGVFIAHSALTNARATLRPTHPARRFRVAQEVMFWSIVFVGVYAVYLVLTI